MPGFVFLTNERTTSGPDAAFSINSLGVSLRPDNKWEITPTELFQTYGWESGASRWLTTSTTIGVDEDRLREVHRLFSFRDLR